jgi:glycosyltransferase involved in cell wall biosynthesis
MKRVPGLVSVVIPCYNHGQYIHESIESILHQTYQNFEIIVIDDGSDDPETVRTLKAIDIPRVSVYHQQNAHLSAARNSGIEKSQGAYILPLDSDDRFEPTFIEKALQVLKDRTEVGVVTCHVQRFGSRRAEPFLPEGGSVSNFLIRNNSCGNALFRYECWSDAGGYNPDLRGFEDWDFWLGVTKKGWLVHVIPEFLFFYRDTPGSMFKSVDRHRPELIRKIVERHSDVYREHVVEVLYQKELEIRQLKDRLNALRAARQTSWPYKIRRAARAPLRWARQALTGRKRRPALF